MPTIAAMTLNHRIKNHNNQCPEKRNTNILNDLNDDPQKVAEDIIDQTRLGFREEATKRIVFILDSLHQLQNQIPDFKKQKEEERFSAAKDRIHGWLKEKRKRVSFETLRKDLDETSYLYGCFSQETAQ